MKGLRNYAFAIRRFGTLQFATITAHTLLKNKEARSFEQLVTCNNGDAQAVGQPPLRFHRQVIACLTDPPLLESGVFPGDVRERASRYLEGIKGARMGAYSHPQGHAVFREDIAKFLMARDGIETDPDRIFITDGASAAAKTVLRLAIRNDKDGVMLPIPRYPIYNTMLALLGGQSVGYFLDEEACWGISLAELERSISEFRRKGGCPRAIVVINPGNPTGQVLSKQEIAAVLKFAERESLAVMADEVYQDHVYAEGKVFHSIRKVAVELGCKTEVFSLHSVSKGFVSECGLRGGFLHCHNVDSQVLDQIYKLASICLCSNTMGQAMMASTLFHPPADGPSSASYHAERDAVKESMKRKAVLLSQRLNSIPGISCQATEGAMYAFPSIDIQPALAEKAKGKGVAPDRQYCSDMLERTGVVGAPGSGFGQRPGTHHMRLTILPSEQTLDDILTHIANFHAVHGNGFD
jgi:aspartate/methionine/tyrosine aminotransferase